MYYKRLEALTYFFASSNITLSFEFQFWRVVKSRLVS